MQKPIVTVAIPVYNGELFIKQAIDSVLNQTYKNFVLKIFDNCSTDRTSEIIYSFNDKRIKYIKNKKNIGMLPNWKKALDSATTKYVALLFSDDFYKPMFLEKTIKIFENNSKIAIVSAGAEIYNIRNQLVGSRKRSKIGIFSSKEYYKYIYTLKEVPPPSETILLNKAVKEVKGYDIKNLNWTVDGDLYLKIAKAGYKAYHLEDNLTCRRSWEGNSTKSIWSNNKNVEDRYYLLGKYFDNELIDGKTKIDSYSRVWKVVKNNIYINLLKMNFRQIRMQYKIFRNNDIKYSHNHFYKIRYLSEIFFFISIALSKNIVRKYCPMIVKLKRYIKNLQEGAE